MSKTKKQFSKKGGTSGAGLFDIFGNSNEEKKDVKSEETKPEETNTTEIFLTDKLSTQPCNDSQYKEIGIIHLSDSMALNIVRNAATGVMNVFGQKGMDNTIYDQLRNECFKKMNALLKEDQRVFNLRVDIERDEALIYMHLYGTLFEKRPIEVEEDEPEEEEFEPEEEKDEQHEEEEFEPELESQVVEPELESLEVRVEEMDSEKIQHVIDELKSENEKLKKEIEELKMAKM